ncbi:MULTISPECIES: hypothetical protein [Gammaproteobacteria]|uniref:hypothetical protein n=1 Tax=Gammaproteobacteria TaxID=1236 RepID=UPI001ADCB800|nr:MULTISPECIES: hypothetical protein [Gammaproteobacteria]MBO9484001.1 hypothetical protein [Salinisphaera sp. G21_0]MBO9495553.1 hypothetical protein [Thalassotalea sp. G20_0]
MHNYISLIHENIKSRLRCCSEVHFAGIFANVIGRGNTSTLDATHPIFSNHPGRDVWVTGVQHWHSFPEYEEGS